MQCPDWLRNRGGTLTTGSRPDLWFVTFGDEPQYSLAVTPAQGKFGCILRQTINGKRLDQGNVYPSPEAAMTGGLQELGQRLGWV